jgi:hypothetical protein
MEYELINIEVDHSSNSVCLTYTITESSAAKVPVLMSMHGSWRVTRWVNGRPMPKLVFSTRFHGGGALIPDNCVP